MGVESCLSLLQKRQILDVGDKLDGLKEILESLAEDDSSKYANYGSGNMFIAEQGGSVSNQQGGGNDNTFDA